MAVAHEENSSDLPVVPLPTTTGDITVHLSCTLHQSVPPVERERRVLYTGFRLPGRGTDAEREALERLRAIREDAPIKAPHRRPNISGLTVTDVRELRDVRRGASTLAAAWI